MVALAVVMSHELSNGDPQRILSEQNHALQTGLLDAADEALGVAIESSITTPAVPLSPF